MKKIVLINQTTGYLTVDIVNAFLKRYSTVALVAGSVGGIVDRGISEKVIFSKIIKYSRKNVILRILTWLLATMQILLLMIFKYRDYYIVYFTNPPTSYFPSLFLKNKYSIVVYDIYPDALKNIGMTEASLIFRIWAMFNKRLYNKAETVFTLSKGMARALSLYCAEYKVKVISNWSSFSTLHSVIRDGNVFVQKNDLIGKFVIEYAGNIGYTHNVEVIMELAKKLGDNPEFVFLIIGEGGKKQELIKYVEEEGLSNCFFFPYQPIEQMNESLSAADISIVTLADDAASVSVPSKTYNLLAVGSPLLCIAPIESELSSLVNKYNCGKCFTSGEVDAMVDFIKDLKCNPEKLRKYSDNSLVASLDFTHKNADLYVL